MKRLLLLGVLLGLAGPAAASSVSVSVQVNGPPSTAITCGLGAFTFNNTVPAGTVICPITVLPAGWVGNVALGGADASFFTLSGLNLIVGSADIPPRTAPYSVTLTATP